ncbi:MAG: aldo/keto reductase [Bacteroidetes bacterium]|nr:aldo/keto reductase [Bacteroidota bacterium]
MINKLVLGTVQFGLNYGINNSNGMPSEDEVFKILDTAYDNGIYNLDTADAYGNAISVIGKYHRSRHNKFNLFSKFKSVKYGEFERVVNASLEKLDIERFEVYSYHSFKDYSDDKNIIEDLINLKKKGLVNKIGISVYTNYELEIVVQDNFIDVIQLPFNLLDNQNLRGKLVSMARRNGKEVHARSVFPARIVF